MWILAAVLNATFNQTPNACCIASLAVLKLNVAGCSEPGLGDVYNDPERLVVAIDP